MNNLKEFSIVSLIRIIFLKHLSNCLLFFLAGVEKNLSSPPSPPLQHCAEEEEGVHHVNRYTHEADLLQDHEQDIEKIRRHNYGDNVDDQAKKECPSTRKQSCGKEVQE